MNTPQEENELPGANWLLDIVIGMSDGLTVPFALAAGASGVVQSADKVLTIGLAGTGAGAIIMAIGGYLTKKKEQANTNNMAEMYRHLDLSEEAVKDVEKENNDWTVFTRQVELPPSNAATSALIIGFSYIAGGLVPLSSYFFVDRPVEALQLSAVITLSVLFIFSYFKSRFTGLHPWLGALQGTGIAAIAAGAAFGVAKLFT